MSNELIWKVYLTYNEPCQEITCCIIIYKLEDGRIQGQVHGQGVLIDQIFIHEQLGISSEGVVDATNATFHEAKIALRKIAGPHAFVENE
jgi:hypothetical protein